MPISHHSHSGQYCKHASGTLEDVVKEAVRQGFLIYGLSEHVPRYRLQDRYPEEEGLEVAALIKQFDDFLQEAHRLKSLYKDRISILVGAETEYITKQDVVHLKALLEKCGDRIEYLVGSVHHVNEIPIDFDRQTFDRALSSLPAPDNSTPLQSLLCEYFDLQYEILQNFQPEIIGHFDLCRLYHPKMPLSSYPEVWSRVQRNVEYAINYGALFECNAAAFRKGWSSAYPQTDIIQLIARLGGRFTLSDDAHGPHAVGLNYDRLYKYLSESGIEELWYLDRSEAQNPGGRRMVPVLLNSQIWHGFFRGLSRGESSGS